MKNNDDYEGILYKPLFSSKKLKIMRNMLFLFFLPILQLMAGNSYSQSTRLSLDIQNVTIEQILNEIEQQSEFYFVFNYKLVDVAKKTDLRVEDEPISNILASLFSDSDTKFMVLDRQILLTPGNLIPDIQAKAQPLKVTGTVTDEDGLSIPGVSVSIRGTTTGTITDSNGNYSIEVPSQDAILIFASIGYKRQEITVGSMNEINVTLITEITELEELVIIGYGSMKKADLTGSVASIKSNEIVQVPTYNLEQALQGRAAGIVVRQNSGSPGARIEVRIRGGNSMIANKEPLYVVDGFPITGDISFLNPADIQSIDILKDASATAIYGARGANGVVMITSKKGTAGQSRIEVNSETGLQLESNRLEMLDARQYAEVVNEYLTNIGQEPYFNLNEIQNPGTDWQDIIYRNGLLNNHTITFSGGTENTIFSLSGNLYDQQGIVKYSDAKKGSLRLNLDHEFNKIISLGMNLNLSRREINNKDSNSGQSMVALALSSPPTLPVYDEDGLPTRPADEYSFANASLLNPATFFPPHKRRSLINTAIGNVALGVNLTKDLSFRSSVGLEYGYSFNDNFTPIIYTNDRGSASQSSSFRNSVLIEDILTYSKSFSEKHNVNLVAGYTYQTYSTRSLGISVSGFVNNTLDSYDLGAAETINNPSSGYSDWTIASWIGRANYSYDNKYLFTGSIRADGSSRFGANNKWAIFPSGAVAWRVTEEPFMENIRAINYLKLRASYGVSGNTAILPYEALNRLGSTKYVFGNAVEATGFVPVSIPNPDLRWESTAQLDLGFDLGVVDNRFRFTFDYYKKITSDLLSAVILPPSSGFETSIKNVGKIENKGLELSIEADILKNEFKWDVSASISGNRNKVLELAEGVDIMGQRIPAFNRVTISREGEPLQSFYGYVEDGFDAEGLVKFKDMNEDGEIDPLDMTILGNPFPDFIFGFNSHFSYKNFDLNIFFEGVQGNDLWWGTAGNHLNSFQNNSNQLAELYGNTWTAENPDAKYQKIQNISSELNTDRFVKDGSYVKLKSLRLAYILPTDNISWLGRTQVFISGTNLITLTDYPGIDPDVNAFGSDSQNVSARNEGGWLTTGIDFMSYPVARTYSVGLSLTF